jgi:peptidylprolyl isomerase
VRALLASRIVLREAVNQKWDQRPDVALQLKRVHDSALTELFLEAMSKPPESYPSETELQAAYDANKSAFLVPRQFRIAQIFIAAPKGADKVVEDKARKKLEDVQRRLKQKPADFAALATTESDEPEAAKHASELPWLPESQIMPDIRTQIAGLAKDAIGEPVRLDDGWHIVKLVDTKAAYTPALSEIRDPLTQRMRAERALLNRRAYLAKLLEQNPAALNELALSKLLKPEKAEK